MSENEILKKAVQHFGVYPQMFLLCEEMAELTKAIMKFKRYDFECSADNLMEEIADVQIMIEQMRIIFNTDIIDKYRVEKLKRLSSIIGLKEY